MNRGYWYVVTAICAGLAIGISPAWAAGAAAFLVLFLAYQVAKSLSGR